MNKKAQAWGIDLIIASFIFIAGITAFYLFSLNSEGKITNSLLSEGNLIADSILSEGSPINWNQNDVSKIGILTSNKINETKLVMFYNLTKNRYGETKSIFNTKYDYYFFLADSVLANSIAVEGIGKQGVNSTTLIAKNLMKITRFVVYQDKLVTAYLYIWEE